MKNGSALPFLRLLCESASWLEVSWVELLKEILHRSIMGGAALSSLEGRGRDLTSDL